MIKNNKLLTFIIYAACGLLCALPLIYNHLWFLGWIAYVPILINEYVRKDDEYKPYRKAWLRGMSFFFPFGIATFYWIAELYPMDFVGFDPFTAIVVIGFGILALSLLQSIFSALNVVLLCFLKRNRVRQWMYPIAAASSWIILEWTQTLTWAGVPWGKMAIGQVGVLQNIQSASLFGPYFISFIMIAFSGLLALGIASLVRKRGIKRTLIPLALAIVLFGSNFIYGSIAMNAEKKYNTTFKAAAIQANIGTAEKWGNDPDGALIAHEDLAELATADGADLVVMAETAIPFVINNNEILTEYIESIVYRNKIDLIVGCYTKSEKRDMYNSTVYVSNESGITDQIYRKQKLVPFGEYIPMGSTLRELFPFLSELNMLSSDIAPGITSSIMETEYGKIGSLICFDSIYEEIALQTVRDGAEILVISTNDAWFRDSAAATQHNAHAILRSVELGRYVIRSGNTGISSIITDKGEIVTSLPALVEGYIVEEVKTTSEKTLYTYVGNNIVAVAAMYLLVVCVYLFISARQVSKRLDRAQALKRK